LKISDFYWFFLCTFTYVDLLCRTVYSFYLSFYSTILYDCHLENIAINNYC